MKKLDTVVRSSNDVLDLGALEAVDGGDHVTVETSEKTVVKESAPTVAAIPACPTIGVIAF